MRFRPNPNAPAKKVVIEAKPDSTLETLGQNQRVYDKSRGGEIERAENVAAGLPPDGAVAAPVEAGKRGYREPNLETPDEVKEDFKPVEIEERPKNLFEAIKMTAQKVIKRVQRLIRKVEPSDKEVIINAESLETRVAVTEKGRLEEFTIERNTEERLVGSIYKGRVRNLEDGLKAAFVDIGFEKNAFLHYWDIVPNQFDSGVEIVEREPRRGRPEKPKITQKDIPRVYPPGSDIVIQVTKGPIGTKGPRVTTNLVLPGRYLVLLPNSDKSGISRKIEHPEERQRLKRILRELEIPEGMGVIMRTVGEGQQKRYFVRDLALLLEEWRAIQEKIQNGPSPSCVFQEPDLIERTVRDFLTEEVERIVVDSQAAFDRIQEIIGRISKRSLAKVKLYAEHQSIFDRFNITKQLETTFSRQVMLKGGGYIVIDETEALVAIDVNTGRHKGSKDQDTTILKVNLEAAEEIARQLRLRNMGGLIVLDFIDMKSRRDQQNVYQRVKDGLRRDKAKTHILPISQLGLMEMTRQRHSESTRSAVYDDCPYCKGRGKVKSAVTMSVEIQRKLGEIMKKRERDESDFQLKILVHSTVLTRLNNDDRQLITDLEKRHYGKVTLKSDPILHAEEYRIINGVTNEELARA